MSLQWSVDWLNMVKVPARWRTCCAIRNDNENMRLCRTDPFMIFPRNWLKMVFTFVPMVTVAACVFFGCGSRSRNSPYSDYELNAASFDAAHLKLVESNSGIVLPSDSKGQNMLWRGQQLDPSLLAKIVITSNSVDSFQKQVERLPNQKIDVGVPTTFGITWCRVFQGKIVETK